MAAKVNLSIREGATFRRRLRWLDSKKRPVNLTGATITAQIRDRADGNLLLDLNVGNGRIVVTPTQGQIDLFIAPADTSQMTYTKAAWDLRVEFSNGDVLYPVEGSVAVARSVTE